MFKIKTLAATSVNIDSTSLISYNNSRVLLSPNNSQDGKFVDALVATLLEFAQCSCPAFLYHSKKLESFSSASSIFILQTKEGFWIFEFSDRINNQITIFAPLLRSYDEFELRPLISDLFAQEPRFMLWYCA